ncbi:MAG: hypothetical protein ABIS67_15155 [Candidatus Eisenbacteria bacterium]
MPLLVLTGLLGAAPSISQTIRPVVVEYRAHRAQGRFELMNEGLTPLNVVLEPKSFDVTQDGEPLYRPLDPGIHVRLSNMSLTIPPRQSRFVFYEASSDSVPQWFVITSKLSGFPRRNGLDMCVELPHTVYLVQPHAMSRADVTVRSCEYRAGEKILELELVNLSGNLGRALETEVVGPRHRERYPSFPLLPHGRRRVRIRWGGASDPDRVVVRFNGFAVRGWPGETAHISD